MEQPLVQWFSLFPAEWFSTTETIMLNFWFWLFLALGVALLIYLVVRFRLRGIRRIISELEKRVADQAGDLQNAQEELLKTKSMLEQQSNEISSLQVKLQEQAIYDTLTGLYNHRYLADVLEKELARARRQKTSLVFMLLNLDHFKEVNDIYGHVGADKTLVALSNLLQKYTRINDYAFRYGGEEFMIIMADIDLDDAYKRAEYLRAAVQALWVQHEGKVIPLTTSIGLASYPQHGNSAEAVLLAMDDALYQAKRLGRDRVEIYTPEEHPQTRRATGR